jgi:hypothetical protein
MRCTLVWGEIFVNPEEPRPTSQQVRLSRLN